VVVVVSPSVVTQVANLEGLQLSPHALDEAGGSGGGGIAFVSHFDVTSGTGAAAAWLTTRGVSRNAVLSVTPHRWRGGGARVGGSWVQGG